MTAIEILQYTPDADSFRRNQTQLESDVLPAASATKRAADPQANRFPWERFEPKIVVDFVGAQLASRPIRLNCGMSPPVDLIGIQRL